MTTLLPQHEHELMVGSGITRDVIAARDYRYVTAIEAHGLGFAESQCRPGLAAQLWTTAGVRGLWILKPDEPRIGKNGKLIKYEIPAGALPHFDIHPGAQPLLRDASVPLFWTEGHKKGDALWSRGLPCISLTGVFQFLHNKMVVPDFDEIDLVDRAVYVVFDSDVSRKRDVANALLRLCEALRRRGAKVNVIHLPEVVS
jgi:Domain of unknown function (DUF3854)